MEERPIGSPRWPVPLHARFDPETGTIEGRPLSTRRLSDLRGCFADEAAYAAALRQDDPVVYAVATVEPADGAGQMHYGLGTIRPGRVGREFFQTRGHYHARREAAEVYIGLRGDGLMLMEEEATGSTRLVPLVRDSVVYVPGHTAHRTINVGEGPLSYLGIYPADAGHDYAALAESGFRQAVVAGPDGPALVDRASLESIPPVYPSDPSNRDPR